MMLIAFLLVFILALTVSGYIRLRREIAIERKQPIISAGQAR